MRSLFERVRCSAWRTASSRSLSVAFAWSDCIARLCCESCCVRNLRGRSSVRSNSLHCVIASMKTWRVSRTPLAHLSSSRRARPCAIGRLNTVRDSFKIGCVRRQIMGFDNPASTHFSSASRPWKTRCVEPAITCVLLRKPIRWRASFPCRKCSTRCRHRKGKTTKYWVFRVDDDYL